MKKQKPPLQIGTSGGRPAGPSGQIRTISPTWYVGIDPGVSGAAAAVISEPRALPPGWEPLQIQKLAPGPYDFVSWLKELQMFGRLVAVLEKAGWVPTDGHAKKGVTGFLKHVGVLEGILIGYPIPHRIVTPKSWQVKLGCLTKGDKNVTKIAAQRLFPKYVSFITHTTADAILLAEYCRRFGGFREGD